MKTILVPVDFSKKSEYAVKLASNIAKNSECEIHLLHMVELPTGIVDMGAGSNFSIPESMMYLRKVKEKITKLKESFFPEDDTVKHGIRFQNPYEGITEYGAKIEADLIVMGSKGISDFEEILIGSNTEKVVRTSKIPVIVVKKDVENFKMKNIVFASNFKDESKDSFTKLVDFSTQFKSKIHLLKVNTIDKFESSSASKEKIKEFISEFSVPKSTINVYNDVSVVKGIINFSKEINADLIALSTHGRSGLSHLFNGSISKNLSKNVIRPLITFKI
ncbi:universal stress protein [Flavobacteriaceae bacterium S356]|uniref:Universal stress protein n=1 Tax=Asprobacillus argus TaxID=3076534 RepID=A0ABU3LCP4_9FLAO|nr:universal stress protein [Flavobacteriaceae bacterium S356]